MQRSIGHTIGIDGLTCGQMQHHAKNLFSLEACALKLTSQFALQSIVTAEKLVANKVVKLASLLLKEANFFLFGHVLNVALHLGKCRWLRSFFTPANGVEQVNASLAFGGIRLVDIGFLGGLAKLHLLGFSLTIFGQHVSNSLREHGHLLGLGAFFLRLLAE